VRGTNEFHENWATTNSNDSTVHVCQVDVIRLFGSNYYSNKIYLLHKKQEKLQTCVKDGGWKLCQEI
jgi:hypothetical protein